jgi:hypothetical protein
MQHRDERLGGAAHPRAPAVRTRAVWSASIQTNLELVPGIVQVSAQIVDQLGALRETSRSG